MVLPMIALNVLSAMLALLAAVFWFLSSRPKLPDRVPSLYGESSPEQQQVLGALRAQSRLSAWGAIAAGLAALCQAGAMLLPG